MYLGLGLVRWGHNQNLGMYLELWVADFGLNMSVVVPGLSNLQMGLWHHHQNLESCFQTLKISK